MRHLNYGHLHYFWTVAREGSIVRAAEVLHITPQTISGQLKQLEAAIGQPLFDKAGRRLVLSETGRVVYEYAEDIFTIGAELATVVRGQPARGPSLLNIGVVMSMPKLVVERVVAPALTGDNPIRVACREGTLEQLLADMAVHRLDLVLSDQPLPPGLGLRAWNHRLGSSGMSFFAVKARAAKLRRRFPESLNGERMLMPSRESALRRLMDEWLEANDLQPQVIGEFDDSALLKAFGEAGVGLFAAPTVIEREICRMYRTSVIGRAPGVEEHFYAISPERRLRQDAVVAICNSAREDLFAAGDLAPY
jgi:LysR family transcriptional activator of nhaA